jgi:DNA repair protein RecN (Recombination protein N)
MLSTLHIHNFAIVSQLMLECPTKMSAFTGETGAGKSIMIDALSILLGGRTDAGIIRPQHDKCEISAQFFYDSHSQVEEFLAQYEYLEEPGEVIIRRVINKDGRSKFFINRHVCSGQQVKALGQLLVHIHGQHEQQSLLLHQTHREQLDNFADLQADKLSLKKLYLDYTQALEQLKKIESEHTSQEQLQLWEYQLAELLELQPEEHELDQLYQEHHQLHHAHQYLQTIEQTQLLIDNDEQINILGQLHQVLQNLNQLPKDQTNIMSAIHLIDSAMIQIDESRDELEKFSEQVQIDPERLAYIEQRMKKWHQLARKFQIDAKQLPEHVAILEQHIQRIKNKDAEKALLKEFCLQKQQMYLEKAQSIRHQRLRFAPELAQSIERIIHELGMPHAKLEVDIQPLQDMQPHGMDKVEYRISTNPGSEPGSLAKIASGGELSRISLSIHLITAQRGATPTLLFDEVDVGIGGATAMKVGQRLRELGEKLQIFCVTHQPQVASCAHNHFQVSKYLKDGQTFSNIELLDHNHRIDEIARMLSGISITNQTRNNAKELLDLACS